MKRRAKGMGSIAYLGEGRRKPYVATLNKKSIGTYRTQQDADKALLATVMKSKKVIPTFVNQNIFDDYIDYIYNLQQNRILPDNVDDFPAMDMLNDMFKSQLIASGKVIDVNTSLIDVPTFAEIWGIEYSRLIPTRSFSWCRNMKTTFKNLHPLHELKITEIKTSELQKVFDEETSKNKCGIVKLTKMLSVCRTVFAYALKMDYVDKDYSQYVNLNPTSKPKNNRKPFTVEEVKKILHTDTEAAKLVSLYIFTGARPIELVSMKRENIHLDEDYMIGGVKTKAGKNRMIPIHPAIKPIIKYFLEKYDYKYLFTEDTDEKYYRYYCIKYKECMKTLNIHDHTEAYDTRYTFSTLAKIYHVDTAAHKKIMGHACKDITDDVYTHEPLDFLLNELRKIDIY